VTTPLGGDPHHPDDRPPEAIAPGVLYGFPRLGTQVPAVPARSAVTSSDGHLRPAHRWASTEGAEPRKVGSLRATPFPQQGGHRAKP